MRWIWIDAFVSFESGRRAVAIKNLSLAEEHLHDFVPGYPIHPPSLMIEGMAQTAGILVGEVRGFAEKVILAKVREARFDDYAIAGDQLRYEAVIETLDEAAASTHGTVQRNGDTIGSVSLIFSHADRAMADLGLPEHNFVFNEQFMSILDTYRLRTASRG